jgi:ATP-dependent DNA helicase RecG
MEALVPEGQGRWTRYRIPRSLDSLHNESHSLHSKQLSLDVQQVVIKIAEPARIKKRLHHQEMEQIILKLCQGKWLTRMQLSELLNRNPEGILSRFLTPMVEHGLLRLRYPDKPNRTDQSYTAVSDG